jgi:hypothetical protein
MSSASINQLFLHLLSAAIWDKPADATRFINRDAATWEKIADMARRQSVSALIADKALSLPEGSLPPREQNRVFISQIEQTKALNRKLIHILSLLSGEYEESGFPFLLLKGLGNGVNYPFPLLRNAGDLDMFLYRKEDYERSKKWVTGKGIAFKDDGGIHYNFNFQGVSIENHRRISYFDHKKYDRLFSEWEQELVDKKQFASIDIDGLRVKALPPEMNAFFIFQHMFRHFVHLGVGFRQYCDWLLFLSKYRDNIDAASFTMLSQSYALLYPMQVFARAAVKYLDAPEEIFPFDVTANERHVDMVIEDILESGNFGFHKPGKKRPKEKIRGMWFSYKSGLQRSIKFGAISPEHCRVIPYKRLINRLKIGFR